MEQNIPNSLPLTPPLRYSPYRFAMFSLVAIFIFYQFVGGGISYLISGGENFDVHVLRSSTMIAQVLFLLLPTLWLIRRQHGSIASVISWKVPSMKELFFSLAGLLSLLQMVEVYMQIQDKIPIPDQLAPIIKMMKEMIEETYRVLVTAHSPAELLFVLTVVAVTPSFCEEVLFRGLVQQNFSAANGAQRGFIITGVVFGLYHFNPFMAIPLVAIGIYLSYLRYRSQSIVLPIIAHFINNGLSTIGVYLYGFDAMSQTAAMDSQETSMVSLGSKLMIFLILFIVSMYMYQKATQSGDNGSHA